MAGRERDGDDADDVKERDIGLQPRPIVDRARRDGDRHHPDHREGGEEIPRDPGRDMQIGDVAEDQGGVGGGGDDRQEPRGPRPAREPEADDADAAEQDERHHRRADLLTHHHRIRRQLVDREEDGGEDQRGRGDAHDPGPPLGRDLGLADQPVRGVVGGTPDRPQEARRRPGRPEAGKGAGERAGAHGALYRLEPGRAETAAPKGRIRVGSSRSRVRAATTIARASGNAALRLSPLAGGGPGLRPNERSEAKRG